jgi:two-component system, chemotaxis family, protein-glutamate methylesterase/glutaminase
VSSSFLPAAGKNSDCDESGQVESLHASLSELPVSCNLSFPPFLAGTMFDVVAIATSAGGLQALSQVLTHLPVDFPAAIVIVQHLLPRAQNLLPGILARRTRLAVRAAVAGARLMAATVYVALPDWHLLIAADGTIKLAQTEKVHFTRPAADCLFQSLAQSCRCRAIAVVLSGNGQDGARGIQQIKQLGGITIVQDPATAEFPGMPLAAIQTGMVDFILPLNQIAPMLVQLVHSDRETERE